MMLSKDILKVQPSATMATAAITKKMKQAGVDVLDLTIGQPDFETPKMIGRAAIAAIESGKASFYTAAGGIESLKNAIIERVKAETGVSYQQNETIVTDGAKFALYALFQVLLNENDEVLVPVPYWVSYAEQVRLAGGKPIFVKPDVAGSNKITVDELEAARTSRTKVIIINSPQNPSGAVYSHDELLLIGNWAIKNNIRIVSDEIYSKLVYDNTKFTSMVGLSKAIKEQTILITGVSKTYSMTGWRIGYALGDEKIIKAMTTLASHATSNPSTVSQYAALEALTMRQDIVDEMKAAFEERLNVIYPLINDIPGFTLNQKPNGAFYLFPNVKAAVIATGFSTTDDFVKALLTEANVAVVAGRAFGAPDHLRLSYAINKSKLIGAANRIRSFVQENSH